MKLFTYENSDKNELLAAQCMINGSEHLIPLHLLGFDFAGMQELIAASAADDTLLSQVEAALKNAESSISESQICGSAAEFSANDCIAFSDARLHAPIERPRQDIICLGINYMAHAEESARYKEEAFGGERPYAVYFSKRVSGAVADGGNIPAYEGLVDSLDYEVELAVIIGKEAKNVSEEEAFEHIFGYTVINDVSARNLQTRHKQWYFGKSLDGFTPMGPGIVTADEIPYPPVLDIKSYVNDEIRQNSSTSLLIFGISHVISELSQGMALLPGTIIAMGTPAGVGMGFQPPKFLKPGDKVVCEIEKIGTLTNYVK